ncbi:MAG: twin-arginine translocase TatA/TatE family subunit [candidate division WOR-3 bacterium]
MNIGLPEILLILLLIILLFGAKKLPDLARSLGEALREFRKAQKEGKAVDQGEEANNGEDKEGRG